VFENPTDVLLSFAVKSLMFFLPLAVALFFSLANRPNRGYYIYLAASIAMAVFVSYVPLMLRFAFANMDDPDRLRILYVDGLIVLLTVLAGLSYRLARRRGGGVQRYVSDFYRHLVTGVVLSSFVTCLAYVLWRLENLRAVAGFASVFLPFFYLDVWAFLRALTKSSGGRRVPLLWPVALFQDGQGRDMRQAVLRFISLEEFSLDPLQKAWGRSAPLGAGSLIAGLIFSINYPVFFIAHADLAKGAMVGCFFILFLPVTLLAGFALNFLLAPLVLWRGGYAMFKGFGGGLSGGAGAQGGF